MILDNALLVATTKMNQNQKIRVSQYLCEYDSQKGCHNGQGYSLHWACLQGSQLTGVWKCGFEIIP